MRPRRRSRNGPWSRSWAIGDAAPAQTLFYGGSAIFGYSLCTEADARRIADGAFSARPPAVRQLRYDGDDDDDY